MDRLSHLLERFALSAGVFHAGNICGAHDFGRDAGRGHVHLVRRGPVRLIGGPDGGLSITEPSLVFMPRADPHQLVANDRDGADVVCAAVQFGAGEANPITDSLPGLVVMPLSELPGAQPLLQLLVDEAFAQQCGRQAALDRLCEILLIRMLRCCLHRGLVRGGALSGLADPRLAKALTALHANPARAWALTEMAKLAGMSRARFAARFREVTGATPADDLVSWRIALAQSLLRAGRTLTHVAAEVGYGSPSALTRAFVRKTGTPPSGWLKAAEAGRAAG